MDNGKDNGQKVWKIRGNCFEEKIHNFWNNIHFHPTDAIEDDWGRRILDQVSRDRAADYIRIYAMLEDVVGRDAHGKLTYQFEETDRRLDYLVEKGFRLLICFNFLPMAIAAKPECMSALARYKGKRINTSQPADYGEWEEVCRVYTQHLLERYGEENLRQWYFHCWNEPDFPVYFMSDTDRADGMEKVIKEYCKLYDHFAKGVTSACRAVKIGGPSAALSNEFIRGFLTHVRGKSRLDSRQLDSRLDFLSVHTYGTFPANLEKGELVGVENTYKRVVELKKLAQDCGFTDLEMIVDEWGLSTEGFTNASQCPSLEFRNTELFASAYAHLIHTYTERKAPVSKQMICLSGQHNLEKDFHGYRSFFTLSGFPKPIYNAYVMAAKLGDRLLSGHGFDPESEIGVFPTAVNDGRIAIMVYRFHPDQKKTVSARHIRLEVEELYGNYRICHYRLDHENANSYTAWKERGSKPHSSQIEREEILEAGRLKSWYPEEIRTLNGKWQMDLVLPANAVSLLELTPAK